jgi:signal peptidase I
MRGSRYRGYRYRSYRDPHPLRRKLLKAGFFIFLLFLAHMFVTTFLLVPLKITSSSMEPALDPGDKVLVSPLVYGKSMMEMDLSLPQIHPPERGDLVLINPPGSKPPPWYVRILEPFIRFFTFNKATLVKENPWENRLMIKRLLALPGDTIKMEEYQLFIKQQGIDKYYHELAFIEHQYTIEGFELPEGWQKEDPFSGNLQPFTLKEGQFFLLGDNRQSSSDSLLWGPVSFDSFKGKVIMKIWPEVLLYKRTK